MWLLAELFSSTQILMETTSSLVLLRAEQKAPSDLVGRRHSPSILPHQPPAFFPWLSLRQTAILAILCLRFGMKLHRTPLCCYPTCQAVVVPSPFGQPFDPIFSISTMLTNLWSSRFPTQGLVFFAGSSCKIRPPAGQV